MLRFDYLDDSEAAICILEDADSKLYIRHVDKKWLEILDESKIPDDQLLSSILPHTDYIIIQNACNKLSSGLKVYHFIHCFNSDHKRMPFSISLISLKTTKNYIIAYATEMKFPIRSYDKQLRNELNQAFYNVSFDSVFTLQLTYSDHLLLVNYNTIFSELFHMKKMHYEFQDLTSLLPPDVVSFFVRNVKEAINSQTTLSRSVEYYYTKEEQTRYLCPSKNNLIGLVTFLPLSQPEYRSVLVCAKDISEEVSAKRTNQELLEEYQTLFNTSTSPTTVFRFSEDGIPSIERRNLAMERTQLLLNPLEKEQLFDLPIWKEMLVSKRTCETAYTVVRNNRKYHYKFMLIPILRNGHLFKAIFAMVDSTALVNEQLIHKTPLSKRELEILSYVIKGEKNSFIATTLGISDGTVKRTISNAYSKLGISSRVELLNYYHTNNFD